MKTDLEGMDQAVEASEQLIFLACKEAFGEGFRAALRFRDQNQ